MEQERIFFEFLNEYRDFLHEMIETEQEKLAALVSNELIRIEQSLSQQQLMAKRFESMESKRSSLQRQAGFANLSFTEIINLSEEADRPSLFACFGNITQSIEQIQFLNQKSMGLVRDQMRLMQHQNGHSPKAQQYGRHQETASFSTPSWVEKKA